MKIDIETKVKSRQYGAMIVFCIVASFFMWIFIGFFEGYENITAIVIALLSFIVLLIVGLSVLKSDLHKKADKYLPDNEIINQANKIHKSRGYKEIIFKTELKNYDKNVPPLGRILYGDKDVFEKKVRFKD